MAYQNDPQQDVRGSIRLTKDLILNKCMGKTTATALVSASGAISMDCSLGDDFTNTPTETTTITPVNIVPGQLVTITFLTSGATSYTSTFGTGILSTGTLASGTTSAKTFVVVLKGNAAGTALTEISRTSAM